MKAAMLLEGDFESAFTEGSNAKIIATDTQKNTLFALAKKYPVEPIEEWTVNVAKDMMSRHAHVSAVNIAVEVDPWERIKVEGKEHNHAFRKSLSGTRFCNMRLAKNGDLSIVSGFKDLQVLKTTQSGFTGFLRDEYTTLKETTDRVLSTKIECSWVFSNPKQVKSARYLQIHKEIEKINLELFAGPPQTGVYSASVQETIYQIGVKVLQSCPEVEKVSLALPNIHYFLVDFKQFNTNMTNNNEVFFNVDGPHGQIEGTVERKNLRTRAKL